MDYTKQQMDEALTELVRRGTAAAFIDGNDELRFIHARYCEASGDGWLAGSQWVAAEDILTASQVLALLSEREV
jgi:hypothetical protein